jgi:hypothetical protein
MSKTVDLSLSQIETLIQEGYQAALSDMNTLGLLEAKHSHDPEVMKEMECSVVTLGKRSFERYYNCQQDGLNRN